MKFQVDGFVIERVAKAGAWLVTSDSAVELGLLFLRPQEFYESGNPAFCGKAFTITEFMQWYIERTREENKPAEAAFTYFEDFQGYNIPGEVVEQYLKLPLPELSVWDTRFARIATVVQQHQRGKFYLIGALTTKTAVIEHELAHAMYYLVPGYHLAMDKLLATLPPDARSVINAALAEQRYSPAVFFDETQAYMATGLLEKMENLENLRMPFMRTFNSWKRRFMPAPRKKRIAA